MRSSNLLASTHYIENLIGWGQNSKDKNSPKIQQFIKSYNITPEKTSFKRLGASL